MTLLEETAARIADGKVVASDESLEVLLEKWDGSVKTLVLSARRSGWLQLVEILAKDRNRFDPTTLYSKVQAGSLGRYLGADVVTDSYTDADARVFDTNYLLA